MSFLAAAVAFIVSAHLASASPLSVTDARSPLSNLPIRTLDTSSPLTNVTFSPAGVHSDAARTTTPSQLITCTAANCAGVCDTISLPTEFNTCLGAPAFVSFGVVQQFDEALGYSVLVGPSGCESFFEVPTLNECFNINGATFTDFDILEG